MKWLLRRWKGVLATTLSLCLSVIVLFILAEVMLGIAVARRMQEGADPVVAPSEIPGLGYQLASNYDNGWLRTEARGMRWRPPDESPVDRTVLLLGDSVAFAAGVPYAKSFGALLEGELGRRLDENVAVWNAAAPGYNTEQEATLLEHLGPSVKPNLIIVQFCMNDYVAPPVLAAGSTLEVSRQADGQSLLRFFSSSRTLFFAKEKIKDAQKMYPEWFPAWAHYVRYLHRREGWQQVKQALLRIQRTASHLNARLLVVIVPVEQQLRIPDRTAQTDLQAFANANGITTLDLFDSFQRQWREGLFFDYLAQVPVVDKLHLNERGHAVALREIAAAITREPDGYFPAKVH